MPDIAYIPFNATYVRGHLNVTLQGLYDAWVVANPSKASTLTSICAPIVEAIRAAVANDPGAELPLGSTEIPIALAGYAFSIAHFHLKTEMGQEITDGDIVGFSRAELAIRQGLRPGGMVLTGAPTVETGTPSIGEAAEVERDTDAGTTLA
jgi:hypothetical protein